MSYGFQNNIATIRSDYCCIEDCNEKAECSDANHNKFCAEHYKEYGKVKENTSHLRNNDKTWFL